MEYIRGAGGEDKQHRTSDTGENQGLRILENKRGELKQVSD